MKLKEMLSLIGSTWEKQEDDIESRVRVDILTCPIDEYLENPSEYLGDLLVSYKSDYKAESFLKEDLLNREVLRIVAPGKDVIMIQIEEG